MKKKFNKKIPMNKSAWREYQIICADVAARIYERYGTELFTTDWSGQDFDLRSMLKDVNNDYKQWVKKYHNNSGIWNMWSYPDRWKTVIKHIKKMGYIEMISPSWKMGMPAQYKIVEDKIPELEEM